MRKLIAIMALCFLTTGCALFQQKSDIPVSKTLSPAAQAVQNLINEANMLAIAASNVSAQQAVDGIITKARGLSEQDKIRYFGEKVDKVQKLLDEGNILDAKTQAALLSAAIKELHSEVLARRKP